MPLAGKTKPINGLLHLSQDGRKIKSTSEVRSIPTVSSQSLTELIYGPNGNVPHEEEEYPFDDGWKCNIY